MADPLIYTRADWGARAVAGIADLHYPVAEVFLHHEGGGVWTSLDIELEKAHMRQLQADTMARGYADFPYGVAVFPSGRAYEGRDLGWVGGGHDAEEAATLGHNDRSIAVVWPGNYDLQPVTPLQVQKTADVIKLAQYFGRVTLTAAIRPHSDVYATACPGARGRAVVPVVASLVHTPAPTPPPKPNPPKVAPMYDPPITVAPVCAALKCPTGGAWTLHADGGIFGWGGAPYKGSPHGDHAQLRAGETWAQLNAPGAGERNAKGQAASYVAITSDGDRSVY